MFGEFKFFSRDILTNVVKNVSWAEIQVQTDAHTIYLRERHIELIGYILLFLAAGLLISLCVTLKWSQDVVLLIEEHFFRHF